MDVEIIPNKRHRTVLRPDGITHDVDTSRMHTSYHVTITEDYDIEDEDVLIDAILRDLGRLTVYLQNIKVNRSHSKNNVSSNVDCFNNYLQNVKGSMPNGEDIDNNREIEL